MLRMNELFVRTQIPIEWNKVKVIPYVRFQMPDGTWVEYPLGEFFASTPNRVQIGEQTYRDIELYDDSIILLDKKFETSYTIKKNTSYDSAIKALLDGAGIKKQNIEQIGFNIEVDIVYNAGVSYMEAINNLLSRVNYIPIFVDAKGYFTSFIYHLPTTQTPEFDFVDDEFSIMYDGVDEEFDYFRVPNRFVLVHSNPDKNIYWKSTITNLDPNSPTSTVNVGRTITHYEEVQDVVSNGVLDNLARRRAYEASQIFGSVTFKTAIVPNFELQDVVYFRNNVLGINQNYLISSYTMELKVGGQMTIVAEKVVGIDGVG